MGSHPTLDQTELAAEARQLDPDDWQHRHADASLAIDHPQVRAGPPSRPSTGSIPPSGCPPTALIASATATSPSARPP
jgi:hypothetical protein